MSFLKRISNAFFWNHLNKIVGYLLDFVLSIVLARGLGDYRYGVYSELFNFIFLFSLVCSLGVDTAINVYVPKSSDQPGVISNLLRKTLFIVGSASLLVVLFLIFLSEPISELINSPELGSLLKIAAFYAILYNFLIIAQTILVSFYVTKFLFVVNSILKLFFIIASYILLVSGKGIQEVIIAFIAISSFVSAAYFYRFFKYLRPEPKNTNIIKFFKFGLVTWLTKFINYILGRYFDIFLLGYFAISKEEIGYYNIAFSITLALFYLFTSGFGGISLTAFSELEKKNSRSKIAKGWLAVTKVCIFFGVPIFIYIISNARIIITTIYSDAFSGCVILFQVFALFYLSTIVIGSGINVTILYALNKERTVLYLRIIMGIVNVVLDFLLIPGYHAMGAIIATGISLTGMVGTEYILARKLIKIRFPYSFLLKISVASLIALSVSLLFSTQNLSWLILNAILFTVGFIICNLILKPFSLDDKQKITEINTMFGTMIKYFCASQN